MVETAAVDIPALVIEHRPELPSRAFAYWHGTGRARDRPRPAGVGVVLLADLDEVDGPRESRLVGVRWVATGYDHAPGGIEPALDVVVYVLASHVYPLPEGVAFPATTGC